MIFGNPYAERMALEATYEDTAVISRNVPRKGADGFAMPSPTPIYSNIICALSKVSNNSVQTDAQQNIRRDMTLYVPPEYDIKAGDTVTVWRFGRTQTSDDFVEKFEVVGKPLRYMTHTEVALKDVSIA